MLNSFNLNKDELKMRQFGAKHENIEYKFLKTIFKDLKKSKERFSIFDFYNDEYIIELKTRTNEYNKYPTTMVSMNKIEYKDNRKKVFIFKFTDGIYRWNMDTDYEIKYFNNRKYAFIKISNLKKI